MRTGQPLRDSTRNASGRRLFNFKSGDTSVGHLIQKIESFTLSLNQFNSVLKRGFDTTTISDQLPTLEEDIVISKENIGLYGQRVNLRNLNVTRVLLTEIQRKLRVWQGQLFGYSTQLAAMNNDIQEMRHDSTLRNLPDDSTLKALYFQQIRDLIRKWRKADSVNRIALINIGSLQSRVAMRYLEVSELNDEVNYRIRNFGKEMFDRDDEWLWKMKPSRYHSSFGEVVSRSFERGKSILTFYLASSARTSVVILALCFFFYIWVRHNRDRIIRQQSNPDEVFSHAEFLARFPVLSSVVFGLVLGMFLYQYPPAAYTTLLGVLLFGLITELLWLKWPQVLHRFWVGIGILYIVNSFLNLLVENTLLERLILLISAGTAMVLGSGVLKSVWINFKRYQKIARLMIILFNVTNGLSVLANISGHYALAKLLCTSAIFTLFLAIGLLFVVEIILDAIYLQSEAYNSANQLAYHFNFKEVKGRIRNGLLMGGGVLWFVGFSKGLSFYDYFYDGISEFLTQERKIGNSSFSFGSVVIFLVVIWISSLLSQLIAYLFDTKGQQGVVKKTNLGSFMLLARIGILAVGILLAFSASGIPMDKLAIVIGALGVGIGFGLQNIVNNLVSGIILAFEKPVQIGDVIDVGLHSGTVKEIGFRSSKITTADGAEVIIPNGDLISQQVVNWTMSNNFRRVELVVGVAYGADLTVCRECILKAVREKEYVLQFPEPLILLHQLAESAVNFRVLFWAADIATWTSTKSQVLQDIYDNLRKSGIDIPFPQRELHIASVGADLINALKDGKAKDGSA